MRWLTTPSRNEVQGKPHADANRQLHVEKLIGALPLMRFLHRSSSENNDGSNLEKYRESRLHGNMHPKIGSTHFVTGSLLGNDKLPVDPWFYTRKKPKCSAISLLYIGNNLCGHPGYVHGGVGIALFDDIFARTAGTIFPSGVAMTAYLNMDFKRPSLPERVYIMRAEIEKAEGRKIWVTGAMRSLPSYAADEMLRQPPAEHGELSEAEKSGELVAEANALFIEPKFADVSSRYDTIELMELTLCSQWYHFSRINRHLWTALKRVEAFVQII